MANREDYDEDQGNQYSQNNQLDLHILQPHFPPHFGPRTPKVLCLQVFNFPIRNDLPLSMRTWKVSLFSFRKKKCFQTNGCKLKNGEDNIKSRDTFYNEVININHAANHLSFVVSNMGEKRRFNDIGLWRKATEIFVLKVNTYDLT